MVAALGWGVAYSEGQGAPPTPDPVEELRAALPLRLDDIANPTPRVLEFRLTTLQKKIDALKTVSDLRRALALDEWKEDAGSILKKEFGDIDTAMRKEVGRRLAERLHALAIGDNPNNRLAAASLIAEMGTSVRALDRNDKAGFARSLTPEVILLTKDDKDVGVRQQALRALGNINAKPEVAAKVFQQVLADDTTNPNQLAPDSPSPKQIAADGLGQMMRVVNLLKKKGQKSSGVEAYPDDVVRTAIAVVGAIKPGLKDADPQVRASCLRVLQEAGQALGELIPESFARKDFPPAGRELTDEERREIIKLHEILQKEIQELSPLSKELRLQEPMLAEALADKDVRVRKAAIESLETVANARLRLQRRIKSVPQIDKDTKTLDLMKEAQTLENLLKNNLTDVVRLLSDSDVAIRRATVNFLENLEESAAPGLPALNAALTDEDRFVRWSAARAIGSIGTDQAAVAVTNLSRLLGDDDLNVRIAAAGTLELMGNLAKGAVGRLTRAIGEGDVESRLAALFALQRMDPELTREALPQILACLDHGDVRLRRAALVNLTKMGQSANSPTTITALRAALGDEDQEVRVRAADALIGIQPATKKN